VGAGVFKYLSFRAVAAAILSLVITILYGKRLIAYLRFKQVGESIRDLGLEGQMQKKGTPTMGGFMILLGLLVPTLLFAQLDNIYVTLLIVTAIWLGLVGFADDYIKVFKKNKEGLQGKFKVIGQVGLGIIVGLTLYYHPSVKVREYQERTVKIEDVTSQDNFAKRLDRTIEESFAYTDINSTETTIPFLKNNRLDYGNYGHWGSWDMTWLVYIGVVILVITAVSNGANITDGIDGLAAGTSGIIVFTLGILAYVSGNTVFAQYLGIMYIPNSGELVVFCAALVGACIGFLWYNAYPAQVFMGDTGSLALGGIIATLALVLRKELLLPLLCGIFVVENLSVVIQVSYFKYTKRKYGEGRRIFKMSPLHHHYQKSNIPEPKIVTRFWIVGIALAAITLGTLKLQ
jgi:phospho-N-acetylmuramoyl-pentapeptide-transferase